MRSYPVKGKHIGSEILWYRQTETQILLLYFRDKDNLFHQIYSYKTKKLQNASRFKRGVKGNQIGSDVCEILWYRVTDR